MKQPKRGSARIEIEFRTIPDRGACFVDHGNSGDDLIESVEYREPSEIRVIVDDRWRIADLPGSMHYAPRVAEW